MIFFWINDDESEFITGIPRTPEILSRDGSLTRGLQPPNSGMRLSLWLQESLSTIEQFQRDAVTIEQNITKLTGLLQQIESSSAVHEVRQIICNLSTFSIFCLLSRPFFNVTRPHSKCHLQGEIEVYTSDTVLKFSTEKKITCIEKSKNRKNWKSGKSIEKAKARWKSFKTQSIAVCNLCWLILKTFMWKFHRMQYNFYNMGNRNIKHNPFPSLQQIVTAGT